MMFRRRRPTETVAAIRDLMKGTKRMNIVLIGATGAIGSRVLDEALRRGHTVSAVTRDPRKLDGASGHDHPGRQHQRRSGAHAAS